VAWASRNYFNLANNAFNMSGGILAAL